MPNQTPAAPKAIGQPCFRSRIARARMHVEGASGRRSLEDQREGEHQREQQDDEAGEQEGERSRLARMWE